MTQNMPLRQSVILFWVCGLLVLKIANAFPVRSLQEHAPSGSVQHLAGIWTLRSVENQWQPVHRGTRALSLNLTLDGQATLFAGCGLVSGSFHAFLDRLIGFQFENDNPTSCIGPTAQALQTNLLSLLPRTFSYRLASTLDSFTPPRFSPPSPQSTSLSASLNEIRVLTLFDSRHRSLLVFSQTIDLASKFSSVVEDQPVRPAGAVFRNPNDF